MQTKNKIIVEFIKSNRKVVFSSFIFGLLSIISSVLIPLFLGKYYQIAFHKHSAKGKIFNEIFGNITGIKEYFLWFAFLLFLKFVFDYFMKYFIGLSGELFSKSIREQLFSNQLNVKYEIHQKKETGLYLLRYSGDLTSIQHYLTKGIISFINDCLFLVFALSILAMLNFNFTLILLASYPIIFFSILYLNKRLKIISTRRRNRRSSNLAFVSSRLNALLTIKAFNREKIETDKYINGSTELYIAGRKYYKLYSLIYALLPFMLYAMLCVILMVAYKTNGAGIKKIHGSIIVTFIMLMVNTIPVLKRILSVNFTWQAGEISFSKLLKVFNAQQEVDNNLEVHKITKGNIVFKKVSFSFSKGDKILNNISFEIPANSLTLVDGNHQSGKSTMFKLITRLYHCEEGEITIDNLNIENYNRLLLRKNITVVSDEFPLIGKTVFEAISYSRKPEKRLPAFNMLKKLGYAKEHDTEAVLDEPIFENGKNISNSQRKILMLARAFLTNKKIMLLDEPFQGLDNILVQRIFTILGELRKNHTVLVIDNSKFQISEYDLTLDLNQ